MDSPLKQRLIGAIILISLGVIFIPMLFSGKGEFYSGDLKSNIPPKPMYEIKAPKFNTPADETAQSQSQSVAADAETPSDNGSTSIRLDSAGKNALEEKIGQTSTDGSNSQSISNNITPDSSPIAQAQSSNPPTKEEKSKVPAEPKEQVVRAANVASNAAASNNNTVASNTKPAQLAPRAHASSEQQPAVTGWVVQIGSFTLQDNAIKLQNELRKKGHASFVESFQGNNGMVYRVRVGPELTKELADALNARIKKETQLNGLVMQFP